MCLVREDQVREWALSELGTHKSAGSGRTHPQVLRELEDVVARPLKRQWPQAKTHEVSSEYEKEKTLFSVRVTEHWHILPREL